MSIIITCDSVLPGVGREGGQDDEDDTLFSGWQDVHTLPLPPSQSHLLPRNTNITN